MVAPENLAGSAADDKEWEHLDAQDELNAEYGGELSNIDAELEANKEKERERGQQVLDTEGEALDTQTQSEQREAEAATDASADEATEKSA